MMHTLKAEFRKVLTVRSTYFLCAAIAALPVALIGFWVHGYKDVLHAATNPMALTSSLLTCAAVTAVFLSFAVVMLVGHEYRYNGILYSLTAVNHRSKLFFAKLLAAAVFASVVAVIAMIANGALFYLGLQLHNVTPVAQQLDYGMVAGHVAAIILGNVVFAFIIAMLARSLIVAIAAVILLPSTIEQLLVLLLRENTKYLPYTALSNFSDVTSKISSTFSLAVVCSYALVFGALAWALFLKRDAN